MRTITRKIQIKNTKSLVKNQRGKRVPRKKADINEDVIREKAYEIFLERGENPGSEFEDWLQAEDELQ
jgi:hypothetical protein